MEVTIRSLPVDKAERITQARRDLCCPEYACINRKEQCDYHMDYAGCESFQNIRTARLLR